MFDHLRPSNYGAQSAADIGVFAVGAAVGGIADAMVNFAGFAEPLVLSGLTGAGALGLKKLVWDAPRAALRTRKTPSERTVALQEIMFEIKLLENKAGKAELERLMRFHDLASQSSLDAESIRRLWLIER